MSLITATIENGVGRIKLNRPEKFNSFNREMALQMQAALDTFSTDNSVRCILIEAEGKAFCAGQDLAEAIAPDGPGIQKIVDEHYNPIIIKIREAQKPVVAVVHGVAAGAGANIALACDIVLAGESASFIQAFSKIGLIPDSGGTFFLPRLIGSQRAAGLMMLADKVGGKEAAEMGMVYKCFEDASLKTEVEKICNQLANMPTKGIALTKMLLNQSATSDLKQQLKLEEVYQAQAGQTYDHKEGVNAFLEKRLPVFKGE
jgi:2-(1,2-epoxy-1,2-dihydrophenyl)acetyl-CoA isomerase